MFTRRQVVTRGGMGALGAAALPVAGATPPEQNSDVVAELRRLGRTVQVPLESALSSNTLAFGYVPKLRDLFTSFLRANQKFPDFCDIGMGVFYDLYDWHVKNRQPLQIGRTADNRLTIHFMFTTLLVRLEADANYLGVPFDRA